VLVAGRHGRLRRRDVRDQQRGRDHAQQVVGVTCVAGALVCATRIPRVWHAT
jgi:hypothetical protein